MDPSGYNSYEEMNLALKIQLILTDITTLKINMYCWYIRLGEASIGGKILKKVIDESFELLLEGDVDIYSIMWTGVEVVYGLAGSEKEISTLKKANKSATSSLPQGIPQEQFSSASKLLRGKVSNISDDIVVQESKASGTAKATSDIEIALRVSPDKFDELINQYFKTPNPGSAKERTMLHAIKTGKIQSGEAKLKGLRLQLQEIFGIDVDISVIKIGGSFDNPPFSPFE